MLSEIEIELTRISPMMQSLVLSPTATIRYDAASGAVIWSDEVPDPTLARVRDLWCLRPVFRYRTTLIMGEPEQEHEHAWDCAQKLFGKWPGFSPWRRSTDLAATAQRLRKESTARHRALPD